MNILSEIRDRHISMNIRAKFNRKEHFASFIQNFETFAINIKVTELFTFENVRENQTEPPTVLKAPEKELRVKTRLKTRYQKYDPLKSNRTC